jgi:single-strand DNA-binding protein
MAGFNRVIMVGNLTRDPEYKQLASGQAVCRLALASNRQFKNRQTGSMVQEVCYIDIDVWGPQAESCRQYLQKGRPVLIEGRLKFDTWEDPQGQTRSKHAIVADRVVFLSAGAGAESIDQDDEPLRAEQSANPAEKELLDQIEQIKNRTRTKAAPKGATRLADENMQTAPSSAGEIAFKDQQPFEDDLPF